MAVHKYNMGVIGNCTYLAYIDLRADVKWMCMPRFDSSFLFGSLLDESNGGHFFIRPAADECEVRQYYVPNSNVLCTEFTCRDGKFVVKDCAPRIRIYERQFRPLMLVRKVELLEGEPAVTVTCQPRGDYGKVIPDAVIGSNHIRYLNLDQQVRL
ncbi:MAG TPA: trehalase-like domain-containing protein, partial [Puia sp.]|nr:trehalase-like domain-containing protein [Puia sp.]